MDLLSAALNSPRLTVPLENEQLPTSLGWTKKTDPVTLEDVSGVTDLIDANTVLTTP